MSTSSGAHTRPIFLTRAGGQFRMAFPFDKALVERMRSIPYATFDRDTKTWSCPISVQAVDELRRLYLEGATDVSVDDLLDPDEQVDEVAPAVLRAGSTRRPFLVHMATRDDRLYSRLRTVPGASWQKSAQALSFPPAAAAALGELVDRGVVDDPDGLLTPAAVVVTFDARTGRFAIRGDRRAQPVFDRHFPGRDVVAVWRDRGLDVAFSDDLSEEIYRAELARHGDGIQPDGLTLPLYPYQASDVAYLLERSGAGVFHQPGVGKTPVAIAAGVELLDRQEVGRVVFVVPAAIRSQVRNEILRFTRAGAADVVVIDGSKTQRHAAYDAAADADWLVVHYDVLHRDFSRLEPLASGALIVFDEAHRTKNPTAKRTKAARKLAKRAARRVAMTGTPVDNDPGEFYSIVGQLAVPGSLGTPHEFLNRYQYPGRFGGYEGARNLTELHQRAKVHYTRWTKADVAEHLPPLRVQQQVLDPDAAYAAALRRIHRQARDEIAKTRVDKVRSAAARQGRLLIGDEIAEAEAGAEMTAVGMLRALCSSPRLLELSDSESAEAIREAGLLVDADGPKLDELRELAAELHANMLRRKTAMAASGAGHARPDDVTGERMVVFTYSRCIADFISARFTVDGVRLGS